MNKTIKKLLLALSLGILVQSAVAANAPADLPRPPVGRNAPGAQRRSLSATDLATYREQSAQFETTARSRTAGASVDTATVVVVVVVGIAVAAVAASGMSNSIVVKP